MRALDGLADRAVIMTNGKLIEAGTLDEIRARHASDDLEQIFLDVTRGEVQ